MVADAPKLYEVIVSAGDSQLRDRIGFEPLKHAASKFC